MDQITLSVTGMMCAHCEMAAEKAVKALPGVESAEADHDANTVEVTYDASLVGREQLAQAIEAAGYTVA